MLSAIPIIHENLPTKELTRKDGKMKKINIYLTDEQKKAIAKKCAWYKVSTSTIVDKCVWRIMSESSDAEFKNSLMLDFFYKDEGRLKTSVKPKIFSEALMNCKKPNRLATNCILLWLKKDLKNHIKDEKLCQRIYSLIDDDLNKAYDKFWNYNEQIRNMRRMLKEDKDYWKRAIEQEERK